MESARRGGHWGSMQGLVRRGRGLLFLVPAFLAGCIPEGIQVPESPLLRSLERKSGLIAYVGTDFNIYTIDQGGGNLSALTDDASLAPDGSGTRIYQFPTWSPAGDKLAYVGISGPSGDFDEVTLYTAAPDGSDTRPVATHSDELSYYLYWSPDGEQISFLSRTASGTGGILKLVSAEGGDTQIVDTGLPYYWDWSPDSNRLLIHAGSSPGARISFLTPGSVVREEGLNLMPGMFQSPAWSPTGEHLLLAVQDERGENELILADRLGRNIQTLARFDGSIAFSWSPDGGKLAYITDEELTTLGTLGPLSVLEMDRLDEPILVRDGLVYAFYWAPDSENLAYFVPVIAAQEGETEPTEPPPVLFQTYVRDLGESDSELITTFLPTEAFAVRIPYFDQYQHSDTIWSPDSRNLVLSVISSSGDPSIWIVPASGGIAPRYIADGFLAYWSWK